MSTLISINPSKNYEVLGEVEVSSEEDIKRAVVKAKEAFITWSDLTVKNRCGCIIDFVKIVETHSDEIAKLMSKETGRPITSSREIVYRCIEYFEAYIKMSEKCLSPKITFETESTIHKIYYEPFGVIAAILPWNYAFMDVAWQCGQGLIAGNTVVYKGAEEIPLTSKLLEKLVNESKIPEGVFNVIYGDHKVGKILLQQDINMIAFTGSSKTGQYLVKIAAEKFIPIVTELGGSSPCIICEDADINEDNLDYIASLRLINNGQACDAIKRLIVHESLFDQVVTGIKTAFENQNLGNPLDEKTTFGSLVSKKQRKLLADQVQDAISKGASVITGGKRPPRLKGAYYMPTVVTNVSRNMRVWKEETFGPVLPVISFKTDEEAIELANDTIYGLTAHTFTSSNERFLKIAQKLQSGSIAQNKIAYWDALNPFGGYKKSGMGRVHGSFGFDEVTQIKLISEER